MPRPAGSPNKDKPFVEALRMELAAAGDNHKALRRIAKTLIGMAEKGDMQAINAIADRLDGKPTQMIAGDVESPLQIIVKRFGGDIGDEKAG